MALYGTDVGSRILGNQFCLAGSKVHFHQRCGIPAAAIGKVENVSRCIKSKEVGRRRIAFGDGDKGLPVDVHILLCSLLWLVVDE